MTYSPEPGYIETRPSSARADEDFFAPNEGPRLCVTCRHHQRRSDVDGVGHFCHRPRAAKIDLVTGEQIAPPAPLLCADQRALVPMIRLGESFVGLCGPLGHYWQPRESDAQ